jgi:hypothetical protein
VEALWREYEGDGEDESSLPGEDGGQETTAALAAPGAAEHPMRQLWKQQDRRAARAAAGSDPEAEEERGGEGDRGDPSGPAAALSPARQPGAYRVSPRRDVQRVSRYHDDFEEEEDGGTGAGAGPSGPGEAELPPPPPSLWPRQDWFRRTSSSSWWPESSGERDSLQFWRSSLWR